MKAISTVGHFTFSSTWFLFNIGDDEYASILEGAEKGKLLGAAASTRILKRTNLPADQLSKVRIGSKSVKSFKSKLAMMVRRIPPLTELVELPGDGRHKRLQYSQILPGAIRGALEMVHLEVRPVFGS